MVSHLQYVDYYKKKLSNWWIIISLFPYASGLFVDIAKTPLIGININQQMVKAQAEVAMEVYTRGLYALEKGY